MPLKLITHKFGTAVHQDEEGHLLPGQTDQGQPDQGQSANNDEDFHWEYKLNLFSAFASLFSFILLVSIRRALVFEFQTWAPFTTSVRSHTSIDLVQNFTNHYENVCEDKNLSIAKFDVNVTNNDKQVTRYLVMPMAYEIEKVPASFLLMWVLAVSAAFQTYRGRFLPAWKELKDEHPMMAWGIILVPHFIAHGAMMGQVNQNALLHELNRWIFLLSLFFICMWIIVNPLAKEEYTNTKPDFGRWFEYILTAPVQVVLVAMSVWSRDRSTLYALFAAQASMIICGVVMEAVIDSIYETNPQGPEPTAQRNRDVRTARGTLFTAWITFALIWYVLISQFLRQGQIDGMCDDCGGFIEQCPYVWYSESNTFNENQTKSKLDFSASYAKYFDNAIETTIPGTNETYRNHTANDLNVTQIRDKFCNACPTKKPDDMCKIVGDQCVGRSNIPPAVTYIVFAQCFFFASFGIVQTMQYALSSNVTNVEEQKNVWYTVSIAYAVLSVVAKTTLEIAFLAMLAQMPESKVSA